MSAAEMSPPKPAADKHPVKTHPDPAALDTHTTAVPPSSPSTDTPIEKTSAKDVDGPPADEVDAADPEPEPVSEDSRRTRSRSEARGRRTLTCKTCRFTCSNTQEFTHHQNTAHTEEAEREVSGAPVRRLSTRHKRAPSASEVEVKTGTKAVAKKIDVNKTPVIHTRKSSSSGASASVEVVSLGQQTTLSTASRKPALADTPSTAKSTSTSSIISPVAVTKESPSTLSDDAEQSGQTSSITLDRAEDTAEPACDPPSPTPTLTSTPTHTPTLPPQPDLPLPAQRSSAQAIISASSRTVVRDLDMSELSEDDEHDFSEEGGRLIIDDAGTPGASNSSGNGSVVVPTRCGNIQNRTYMCDHDNCNFTTTSGQVILHHKKNQHGYAIIIYECDICDYATKYKQKLPRHRNLHFIGADSSMDTSLAQDSMKTSPHRTAGSLNPTHTLTPNSAALAPLSLSCSPPALPLSLPLPQLSHVKRTSAETSMDATTPCVLPSEMIVEEGDDDECDDDDMGDSDTPPPEAGDLSSCATALPPVKKKRKDVSPDKYFEVAEEVASTKYGCAKCGNVYKWKKSLNKHWKEKHGSDPGDSLYTPPGMMILLQQHNHVQTEHRRCCHKTLLERITVKQGDGGGSTGSRTHTPQNFLNGHYAGGSSQPHRSPADEMDGEGPLSGYLPAMPVGPFVLGTNSQPVFPSSGGQRQSLINSLNAPIPSSGSALDLTKHDVDEPDSVDDSAKPLDFSVQRGAHQPPTTPTITPNRSAAGFSGQEATTEEDDEVSALNQLAASKDNLAAGKDILKCPKCGEVLKTQTAYSNHMAMHLHSSNKRVAKCGVCKTHFPNNEALNLHFMDNHLDLIASHKEAIQKIPHGLQQTYHLLKMPLQSIPKLSSQDTEDPLKCNMCDFTAKWPAELQKHAVSHSDERPFVCMVCGSTYKWKWDLVKHFEKAHSNLPNPYKRREAGAPSATQAGGGGAGEVSVSLAASNGEDGYDMEEGEITGPQFKSLPVSLGLNHYNPSTSFLFDQTAPCHDDISVENILRTSQQASLMMSRQPNFLDSPEHTQASSSSTSPHTDHLGEKGLSLDMSSLQPFNRGVHLPHTEAHSEDDGSGSQPIKNALANNIRGRQNGSDILYPTLLPQPKSGSGKSTKSPYKGYRTVEGSESSDLKYQCVLCEYKARWPSEIMQHMKNHSSEKPYGCPNCTYRSKWKWDVVKHLKRCGGGGTIKDVIDYTQKMTARDAPPNVMVTPEGGMVQSQQAASPTSHTSGTDTTASLQPALGVINDNSQTPLLQPPYLPAMSATGTPASTAAAINAFTAQAYVNLLYQRLKAANETAPASVTPPATSGPPAASSSPSPSPSPQSEQAQGVVYTSVINEGQHHCLHCTFAASSLAELRRHQVLHSDEKPYMCSECSYSTKWKCDMKKHKEKYKHNGPIRHVLPNGDVNLLDKNEARKCTYCDFETNSADSLESHIKAKHQASSSNSKQSSPTHSKFKCKKCPYTTNELVDWISHRHQHQGQKDGEDSRQSPVNGAKEHDEARLKHPRKAVKQYACNKCDFVCLKSTELLDHQKQAHGTHSCPFCSQRCDSKDSFLDHLITHQEFKAKEWEFYFMDDSDNEDVNNNTDNPGGAGGSNTTVSYMDTGSSANTIDLTSSHSSPPPLIHANATQGSAAQDSLPCQWCDARFPNIVRLYQHASNAHPQQKREMEIAEGMSQASSPATVTTYTNVPDSRARYQQPALVPPSSSTKSVQGKKRKHSSAQSKPTDKLSSIASSLAANMGVSLLHTPTLVAQLGQPQVSPASLQPTAPSLPTTNPEMGLNLSTKKPHTEQTPTFQCMKCAHKTTDFGDYQHHLMMHMTQAQMRGSMQQSPRGYPASKEEMRCWFCGDEQKSFLAVYQHMQDQHPKELMERGEQKEDLVQKIVKEMQVIHVLQKDENAKVQSAMANSPHPSTQLSGSISRSQQMMMSSGGKVPSWLHQKKVLAYKGTPLQGLKLTHGKGDMWYKCLMCNVMDRLPARVAKHTISVHSALPQKYQCGHCSHSSKKLQGILQHQQSSHPDLQPDVTVLHFEEITLPMRQPAQDTTPLTFSPLTGLTSSSPLSTKPTHAGLPYAIKQEPMPFSPPRTSSPIQSSLEPVPLDLSTDTVENNVGGKYIKDIAPVKTSSTSEEEMMDTDEVAADTQKQLPAASQEKRVDREAQAIMRAEAANVSDKVHGTVKANAGGKSLPVFSCKHCPFTTQSNYEFRNHWSCHGVKARYQCDYCTFSHQYLHVTMQHRTLHSHQPGFSPVYSPKLDLEESSPGSEETASASPAAENLQCPDCPYRTSVRQSFNIHVGMHGQRLQYVCDLCDWSSDRLVILVQHRNVHAEDPDFQASPEDSVFANPEYAKDMSGEFEAKLLDPKAKEEQSQSNAQSPPFKLSITKKQYSCAHCPYVTSNRAAYAYHQTLHGGPGCYACEQCSYRTQRWSLLCQHNRLHSEHKDSQPARSGTSPVAASPSKAAATAISEKVTATSQSSKTDQADDEGRQDEPDHTTPSVQQTPEGGMADEEDMEVADFPDQEGADSCSPASDYGSLKNEDSKSDLSATNPELRCQRCPFSTSSRLLLNQHSKHHSGGGSVVCPCCDYSCPTKENLLVHIQLHFPSTLMDMDNLQHMLSSLHKGPVTPLSKEQPNDPNASMEPSLPKKSKTVKDSTNSAETEKAASESSERDAGKEEEEKAEGSGKVASPQTMRVYACHFCDREFVDKTVVIQHERQCKQ